MRNRNITFLLVLLFFLLNFSCAESMGNVEGNDSERYFSMSFKELANVPVAAVSRFPQSIEEAPAFVSVINRQQIEQMGARNILDVLRVVPGFSHTINQFGLNEIEVRGIRSTSSATIKFLINGISLNNNVFGEATRVFDDMALDNVERIEIVRGSGSALYGSNAMLAVINIITRDLESIRGMEVNFKSGSGDSKELSLLFGKAYQQLKVSGSLSMLETDGLNELISADRLTGSEISLAPRDSDYRNKKLDFRLTLQYQDWKLETLYVDKNRGPYIGPSFALVEEGDFKNRGEYFLLNLEHKVEPAEGLKSRINVFFKRFYFSPDGQIFPPGFGSYDEGGNPKDINKDGILDIFPEGLEAKFELNDNIAGVELLNEYHKFKNHQFIFGSSYSKGWLSGIKAWANHNIIVPGERYKIEGGQQFEQGIVEDYERSNFSIFAQDIWQIYSNAKFTLGLRYDHYSDFGSVISPRIAWGQKITDNFSYKIIYDHAYRAPSFGELARSNNANVIGNPDLDAETVDTFQVGLNWAPNEKAALEINLFHIKMQDRIDRVSRGIVEPGQPVLTFGNQSEVTSHGMEVGFYLQSDRQLSGFGNLTLQKSQTKLDDIAINTPSVPRVKGNLGINWKVRYDSNLNFTANYVGKRERGPNDQRSAVDDYLWSSATFNYRFNRQAKVVLSLYNLFDEEYVDNGHSVFVPYDYPRPGRNFNIRFQYRF